MGAGGETSNSSKQEGQVTGVGSLSMGFFGEG